MAWDRYAYTVNNPIRYMDPTGHTACDNEDVSGGCTDLKTSIRNELESKYTIQLTGGWDEDELIFLDDALTKLSLYAGGNENLNDIFMDAMQANNSTASTLTIQNAPGDTSPCSNGGFACWNNKDTIMLSDYIFTRAYQSGRWRPKELGLSNNLGAGIEVTMIHEMIHVFADARPVAAKLYSWRVPIANSSSEERMANAFSFYVVSGMQNWSGHQKPFDFVREFNWLWHATP